MDDFSLWDVFVSIFWFTMLLAWIALLFSILGDILRDRGLSGGAKALWTAFIVLLPWLGVLTYLVVRGGSMNQRAHQARLDQEHAMREFVQDAAGTRPSVSEELKELARLRDDGLITPADYEQAKVKVLA
jgi:hypothetical protein